MSPKGQGEQNAAEAKRDREAIIKQAKEIFEKINSEMAAQQESFKAKMLVYEAELKKSKLENKHTLDKMERAEAELKKLMECDPESYAKQEPIFFKN